MQKAKPIKQANTLECLNKLKTHITSVLVGQDSLVESMLICLLCDGHMLIEGMPGLAKTTAAKAMAQGVEGTFHRIQFTPDLLPSDLIGTDIFIQEEGSFTFRQGPLFHNIVLADEINRAPAKVQSALLEAMEERQITVGQKTYPLDKLFMVIATQNPIEQEGTYNLPEAQLDRFLMHVVVDYPSHAEELKILERDETKQSSHVNNISTAPSIHQQTIFTARTEVSKIYMSDELKNYVVSLVSATRDPATYDKELANWLLCGASPRATLAITRCAKALAYLKGDAFVSPFHIQSVAPNILRHRIIRSFEAEAENISAQQVIKRTLEVVAVP